ncbi:hypothetical protein HRI96_04410 [Treponema parvum]|uniref:Uncharacterized protein n=1 Tax=Treponema parvum TaxID=138851 RepID=A0A975EZ55_9SPIR|nr:hypothetical protein [Treponema parvum]QTQ11511.1 hypothetical protein HRI96_04410 [Treponema parvum]
MEQCSECYCEYSRITPFFAHENCLKNHKQYLCRTCGRCICIDKMSEIPLNARFTSEKAARYFLRGAEAVYKTECGIFRRKNNSLEYFKILPLYGNLSAKNPAFYIPETYRQPVKKQMIFLNPEQQEKYIEERNEENRRYDYSKDLEIDMPENQVLNFDFVSCKDGIIKLQLKTKSYRLELDFYDDDNDEPNFCWFMLLGKWLYELSKNPLGKPENLNLWSCYGGGFYTFTARENLIKVYTGTEEDEEKVEFSFYGSSDTLFDNFMKAFDVFLTNGTYKREEWEQEKLSEDEENCADDGNSTDYNDNPWSGTDLFHVYGELKKLKQLK